MQQTSMQKYCETRLRNMMIRDKGENTRKIDGVLKAEILYVLKSYMELSDYDLDVDIVVNNRGFYDLTIKAECRNIKSVSYIE